MARLGPAQHSRQRRALTRKTTANKNGAGAVGRARQLLVRKSYHSTQKQNFEMTHLRALQTSQQEQLLRLKTSTKLQSTLLEILKGTLQEELLCGRMRELDMNSKFNKPHRRECVERAFLKLTAALEKVNLEELLKEHRCSINWTRVAARFSATVSTTTGSVFSPETCAQVFSHCLDPCLTHATFTSKELCLLHKTQQETGGHDWEKVAKRLGGGRTAWQCIVRYKRPSRWQDDNWLEPPRARAMSS